MANTVTGYSGLSSKRLAHLLTALLRLKNLGRLSENLQAEYQAIQAERTKRRQNYRTKTLGEEQTDGTI